MLRRMCRPDLIRTPLGRLRLLSTLLRPHFPLVTLRDGLARDDIYREIVARIAARLFGKLVKS